MPVRQTQNLARGLKRAVLLAQRSPAASRNGERTTPGQIAVGNDTSRPLRPPVLKPWESWGARS